MPTARVTQQVVRGQAEHTPGEVVVGEIARDGIAGGWAAPLEDTAETPEHTARRRQRRPETRG